ncbi:hypothetical protein Tco_0344938 [Tanacetum coccineum]
MKGWKDRFLFIDRMVVPDAMAWRHHDSDVNDVLPDNNFSILDVRALAENAINLRPMHPELLFVVDLATVWDFPRYHPIFKDTGGNGNILKTFLYKYVSLRYQIDKIYWDETSTITPLNCYG